MDGGNFGISRWPIQAVLNILGMLCKIRRFQAEARRLGTTALRCSLRH